MGKQNKNGRSKTPPGETFVALRKHMRQCEAWRTLPHTYRSVYIEAVAGVYVGNNGEVSRSVRFLAKAANVSPDTVQKALRVLQDRGFMVCAHSGGLGTRGKGVPAKWRFTEFGTSHRPVPTREYAKWKNDQSGTEDCASGKNSSGCTNPKARTAQQHTPYRQAAHPVPPNSTVEVQVCRQAVHFDGGACTDEQYKATYSHRVSVQEAAAIPPTFTRPRSPTKAETRNQFTCPDCGALPGEPCIFPNDGQGRSQTKRGINHQSRYLLAVEAGKQQLTRTPEDLAELGRVFRGKIKRGEVIEVGNRFIPRDKKLWAVQ
ncbi:MAG: hypothetical protein AAFU49_08075 [Pseudomonadota bacterium]